MTARKILFIDRDGTLIEEPDDFQVDAIDKVRLVAEVIPALIALRDAGFEFVMVSNQDGLGTAAFPQADFEAAHQFTIELFRSQGIEFSETMICPHLPDSDCDCRKPRTGLLTKFLASNTLALDCCAVIGDRETDIQLADALGIKGFQIGETWQWPQIAEEMILQPRRGHVERNTNETRISVSVQLDGESSTSIHTGIGFFDHMLEQIARHGGFSLNVACSGDLDVDDHHSVEDVALALGAALKQALGDKRGIGRYGFTVPMDETVATVAIDLSGRPAFSMQADLLRERVGGMATEMVPHFFQSLAQAIGAAIHIEANGENAHHVIEGCFKAVGRALRPALAINGSDLPSTKGVL
ncbi:MAG: bifunctional histidinol-phosphatase/imidazoleglycerol-phosphate dehydratase HisB [Pseudomonadota bacterium]